MYDLGNLLKSLFGDLLFRRFESVIIIVGNTAAGRQCAGAVVESLNIDQVLGSIER